jgi:ABC-type Fe3+-hydroxamate transport system substrate-binding protein
MVFTDARGTSSREFRTPPKRIVSLVPSQTELLYHLGLDAEVVGITKFCIHPEAWFRSKTRVGGTKKLHMDVINHLQPDLILANKEENGQAEIEALATAFPVWVTDVATFAQALDMIHAVGTLTGKTPDAESICAAISHEFQTLRSVQNGKSLRVSYLIWNDPFMTVGGDTFIHAMLEQAGFQNCFDHAARYPALTPEQLQAAGSDVVFLSSEPYPFSEKHLSLLQAMLPHTRLMLVDGEYFSWYGSRLQAAPAYFKTLHAHLKPGGIGF